MADYILQPNQAGTAAPRVSRRSGKFTRSETVSIRLDQKLRYLAELAARKQRRTLSSYVEWAIDDSLSRIVIWEGEEYPGGPLTRTTIRDVADGLWDVVPADRFAKLALRYPFMLDHTEQIVWKCVTENGAFWRGWFHRQTHYFVWQIDEEHLKFDKLREYWTILNNVARGEARESELPTWTKSNLAPTTSAGVESPPPMDDEDIPF